MLTYFVTYVTDPVTVSFYLYSRKLTFSTLKNNKFDTLTHVYCHVIVCDYKWGLDW
jgi:hypothetical protein